MYLYNVYHVYLTSIHYIPFKKILFIGHIKSSIFSTQKHASFVFVAFRNNRFDKVNTENRWMSVISFLNASSHLLLLLQLFLQAGLLPSRRVPLASKKYLHPKIFVHVPLKKCIVISKLSRNPFHRSFFILKRNNSSKWNDFFGEGTKSNRYFILYMHLLYKVTNR